MDRVDVKPELIQWARRRAGFSVADLERRFPKIEAWERGEVHPTLKQLEGFAKATFTPVGFLFLDKPPVESVPIPDFRTVANTPLGHPSPDLLDTVYLCQQRQDWYRDHARSIREPALSFVNSSHLGDDIVETAKRMRRAIGFDVDQRQRLPTWTEALRHFIEQVDGIGVLVMISGVVGSNNRRNLDPKEFRGFALADSLAPLVFVNGADTKAAQMFTIAHELAHIFLGQSAISDADAYTFPDQKTERWCNAVAAELLVPLQVMQTEFDKGIELQLELHRLARHFKVSKLVILRRIFDAGGMTRSELGIAYDEELERLKGISKGSGGDFYLTLGARVSKRFARAIFVSTQEGHTSFTETFRLLGLKKMATFDELGRSLGVGF